MNESLPAQLQARGALFYTLPEELLRDQIDPLLRDVVFEINRSAWVWTAESCQGHPDADHSYPWAMNTRPMLRLVCEKKNFGRMLECLLEATVFEDEGLNKVNVLDICECRNWGPNYKHVSDPGFREVIVYVRAVTVYERNLGIECYKRFAKLIQ